MSYDEKVRNGFICPISGKIMREPVKAADGYIYEHNEIINFIREFKMSPMIFRELKSERVVKQHYLKENINAYLSLYLDEE
jgi:hypothetical protein